jgi:hypothetical protein
MTPLVSHWQPPPPRPEGPACHAALERDPHAAYLLTTDRRDVTCPHCTDTTAWKDRK